MRIEDELKLDFDNVLIRPKRSTLRSRKDVDLEREYTFKHSKKTWKGIPIMAANMDTVGTMDMSKALADYNMLTCLHKFYTIEDWVQARSRGQVFYEHSMPSIGANQKDLEWYREFNKLHGSFDGKSFDFVCIDVANGYGEYFVEFVEKFRREFPDKTIIAGNVVTGEMTEQLVLSGADIIKCGIGPGCFVPGTRVKTDRGLVSIEDIKVGDKVITHKGNIKPVINTFKYKEKKKVVSINGIKSTAHHEYYAVEKKYKDLLTDDNIHEYAKWVKAEDLDKEKYFLLKHK